MTRALSVLVIALVSCSPREVPPPGRECARTSDSAHDPTTGVSFDPAHLLCVHVEMDPAEFEDLRNEARDPFSVINAPCEAAFPSPFTYRSATVDIDGVRVDNVGIRGKGFVGSMNPNKPSLKIKFDEFVAGVELGDTERITLNNNADEFTRVRTCLSYGILAAAGVPAARCNLAVVVVNDESFGAYSHVDSMKKRFLRATFGNDDGDFYEAQLADIRADRFARFEAKTGDTDESLAPLHRFAQVLELDDDQAFLAALPGVTDVDRFLTFWAMEFILDHLDGYAASQNNYFLYFDPDDGGRATFLPWSVDLALSPSSSPLGEGDINQFTRARIPTRFSRIPQMRARFDLEVRRLLDEVWDEESILAEVDRLAALVRRAQDDPEYEDELDALKTTIRGRRASVERMLEEGLQPRAQESQQCIPNIGN